MTTFICDNCKGEFEFGSEEEAIAEMKANGFGDDKTGMAILCDECYVKVMEFNHHTPGQHNDLDGRYFQRFDGLTITPIKLKPTWKQRLYNSPDVRVFIMGNRLVVGGPDGGVVYVSKAAA